MRTTCKAALAMALALFGSMAHGAQTVFLDFDTFTSGGKYVYTPGDRALVASGLSSIYGDFDVTFTTVPPLAPYSTIFFNFGSGPYGGTSDHIDFLNVDHTDDAYVLAPDLLSAMSVPLTTPNILRASTNLAAHELGHILGMKHQDGFGPPLAGISISPTAYTPTFPGPTAASTATHVMGLSSSLSLSPTTIISPDTHLNFREAIKLASSEAPGIVDAETLAPHDGPPTAQPMVFSTVTVPNTMLGFPDDAFITPTYSVRVDAIEGTLSPDPTLPPAVPVLTDYYSFTGTKGEIVVIEVMSESLAHRLADITDPIVYLLDSAGLPIGYYTGLSFNNDEFESSDAILLDISLPYTGKYYIEVGPVDSLDLSFSGAYELYVYRYMVPEPSSFALGGIGALGLLLLYRRQRAAKAA